MNHDGTAELRIFTGLHAGARAMLTPGTYLLGSDPACDFVICDEGIADQHAELCIDDEKWMFRSLQDAGDSSPESIELAPGVGVPIGPVIISIDAANAPWQEIGTALETGDRAATAMFVGDDGERPEAPPETELPDSACTPAKRFYTRRSLYWLLPLLAAPIVVALMWTRAPPLAEMPLPAAVPASDEAAYLARINDILATLDLRGRVQVQRLAGNGFLVSAALISDEEHEQLAGALSRLNPRPGLAVGNEQDLIQSVIDAVAARDESLKAEYLGSGRFRITGKIGDTADRAALLKELALEFPAVRNFEDALTTPQQMAVQLLDRLRADGFPDAHGHWSNDVFVIDLMTPPDNRLQLARSLAQADLSWGRWLKFSVRTGKPTAASERHDEALPFQVSSVVSGPTPYVILHGGQKLVPGGQIGRWRLVDIDAAHVVFDGPRRITLSR